MAPKQQQLKTVWAGLVAVSLVLANFGALRAEMNGQPVLKIVSGSISVKNPGSGQAWTPGKEGQQIQFEQVILAGSDFEGAVVYSDGTTLTLKPSAMLQVLSDGLRLYRGQTWIKVTKRGKSFTCVTPSAIASVRGTSFSCEVPSLGRVFSRAYRGQFFNQKHFTQGMRGNLITASIGFAMLSDLIGLAPGGRVPAAVKVYEGHVMVSYPAANGKIKQSWMVNGGQMINVADAERSQKMQLTRADYERWALVPPAQTPVPQAVESPGEGQMNIINEFR